MPDQSPQHEFGSAVFKIVPDLSALDEAKGKVQAAADEWKQKLGDALKFDAAFRDLRQNLSAVADEFVQKMKGAIPSAPAPGIPKAFPDAAVAAPQPPQPQTGPTPAPIPNREEVKDQSNEVTWRNQIVTLIGDLRTQVDLMRQALQQLSVK